MEYPDSDDTRTLTEATEGEGAKDDEIQPEDNTPRKFQLDQEGD